MTWYYEHEGREIGPVSKAALAALLKKGRIHGATRVRHAGMRRMRTLAEMVRAGARHDPTIPPSGGPPAPPGPPAVLAPPASPSPPPSDAGNALPFAFHGTGAGYFKVWIVNVLLTIVTLGIYSAWAKVRRKQYFYGNTQVSGSSFRYLADPVKILKGRAVVFLGFIAYTVAGQLIPPVSYAIMLVFVILLPWLVVRSLVFNARNSAWRNIRFNFTGTYREAAKAYLLWPALVPFTLGVLLPYVRYRQKQFVVTHSAYGTTPFAFHARPREYYRIFFAFSLPLTMALIILSVIGVGISQAWLTLRPGIGAVVTVLVVLYLYGLAYFSVKISNLTFNAGSLRRHRFRATMMVPAYGAILLTNTLATVMTLGLFHPFAKVRAYAYKIRHLALLPEGDLGRFVAGQMREVSALGHELSDFMDFDFGI